MTIRHQCSPHHTNSPFYPIIRQFERAARFERDDTADVKLEKLETLLSQAGQTTLADAPLYAALLSIPTGRTLSGVGPDTANGRRISLIEALIRQVLTLARTKPVLFVIEDAHWIDPSTLEGSID